VNPEKRKIGWIGTGETSNSLVYQLIRYGYDVTVFDLDEISTKNLVSLGAKFAVNAQELALASDYLFVSVGREECLKEIFEDKYTGIMSCIKDDAIIIDLSPRKTDYAKDLKERLWNEEKVHILDAPIHDENNSAQHLKMPLTVGGDHAEYLHVLPLLKFFSQELAFVGDTVFTNDNVYAEYQIKYSDV